jgi:hypothetical protein
LDVRGRLHENATELLDVLARQVGRDIEPDLDKMAGGKRGIGGHRELHPALGYLVTDEGCRRGGDRQRPTRPAQPVAKAEA